MPRWRRRRRPVPTPRFRWLVRRIARAAPRAACRTRKGQVVTNARPARGRVESTSPRRRRRPVADVGFYCPLDDMETQIVCPVGTYSLGGAEYCTSCPVGHAPVRKSNVASKWNVCARRLLVFLEDGGADGHRALRLRHVCGDWTGRLHQLPFGDGVPVYGQVDGSTLCPRLIFRGGLARVRSMPRRRGVRIAAPRRTTMCSR